MLAVEFQLARPRVEGQSRAALWDAQGALI